MLKKNTLLGVGVTNETTEDILEYIIKRLHFQLEDRKKFYIVTPNPEILVYAAKHPEYKKILNAAEAALPDGVGVFFAFGLMGNKLQERIPGVDFIEELCKACKEKPISMGFLGGRPGIAVRTAERLREKYPWVRIVFASEEWPESYFGLVSPRGTKQNHTRNDAETSGVVLRSVQSSSALPTIDILFVAFGAPKQEQWIAENLEKLPVKAAMGVGGAFDYISGRVVRAPSIIRAMGFEWLFRLVREPWRWRRQLALVEFVRLVFREWLHRHHSSNV